jgi:hypothetical protein
MKYRHFNRLLFVSLIGISAAAPGAAEEDPAKDRPNGSEVVLERHDSWKKVRYESGREAVLYAFQGLGVVGTDEARMRRLPKGPTIRLRLAGVAPFQPTDGRTVAESFYWKGGPLMTPTPNGGERAIPIESVMSTILDGQMRGKIRWVEFVGDPPGDFPRRLDGYRGYVFSDDEHPKFFNLGVVQIGFAHSDRATDHRFFAEFNSADLKAQGKNLGLWNEKNIRRWVRAKAEHAISSSNRK